jgi:CNT family concentrative nucleoside transporter
MSLRFVSALGVVALILFAWAFSTRRDRFPWWTVGSGLALQIVFAAFILETPFGEGIFGAARTAMNQISVFAQTGAAMVFGPLADQEAVNRGLGGGGVIFAITITSIIIVVSSLSALLYHYGVLPRVVHGVAWIMRRVMRTTGSESLAAAGNIFLGQTEAALIIRPYLPHMTPSELHALMVTGMATIATSVFAVYAQMGIDAGHLLAASVMSAPGGLLMAKILLPETLESETSATHSAVVKRTSVNGIDALCRGAAEGMSLAINVLAMLIAFVAVVALANALFGSLQHAFGAKTPITLEQVFGWVNWPFAWVIGVPTADCAAVGQVLGKRIVLNEFVGFLDLAALKDSISPRSYILATYALCGFANFSSIAIQIGGIGALVPERRGELARLGLRAMVGGLLASYLTAGIAGMFV